MRFGLLRKESVTEAPLPEAAAADSPAKAEAEPGPPPASPHRRKADDQLDLLAQGALKMGTGIVELGGFLDGLETTAASQCAMLTEMRDELGQMLAGMDSAEQNVVGIAASAEETRDIVLQSVDLSRKSGAASQKVASWVSDVGARMSGFMAALAEVDINLSKITEITREVQMLAINAKIEAHRAGESGKGFAVIADAIGSLSKATDEAATGIVSSVQTLKSEAVALDSSAGEISDQARNVLTATKEADRTLDQVSDRVQEFGGLADRIGAEVTRMRETALSIQPKLEGIEQSVQGTASEIGHLARMGRDLTDTSENMVQATVALGGTSADQDYIDRVRQDAGTLSRHLEQAVDEGRLSLADLFDESYEPVPGSNPAQVLARFTELTDRLFPPVQEAALSLSPKVVFCAAVDRNGYLPTHNKKFSKPQGQDVAWNTANCRNRRIFDDRVGLKSGRDTSDFLLQVYRRDMGGGAFQIMKNVSAPITVQGRHWGGLRLAYST